MFGTESPLLWEKAPPLSPLAEHCKMISNMEASIDLPTTVFSFCPWADEYPQAHSAIKACLTIKAWSAASQDI